MAFNVFMPNLQNIFFENYFFAQGHDHNQYIFRELFFAFGTKKNAQSFNPIIFI